MDRPPAHDPRSLSSSRAICASHDAAVCQLVDAALTAAGFTVDHVASPPDPADTAGVALLVADRACRRAAAAALAALRVPVILVADDLDDDSLIALMHDAPVSHLIEDPRDRALAITSRKLATGDLWGLEQYLTAAAAPRERIVHDATKRRAIDEVTAWAATAGAHRPLVHRLANVVDELLMNALLAGRAAATLRFASDSRTLAISVLDTSGTLHQRDLVHHLRRARSDRRPRSHSDAAPGGAGLGLYLVLANVSSLIVNVAPGARTEIVCLFDLPPAGRPPRRARSLHIFANASDPPRCA